MALFTNEEWVSALLLTSALPAISALPAPFAILAIPALLTTLDRLTSDNVGPPRNFGSLYNFGPVSNTTLPTNPHNDQFYNRGSLQPRSGFDSMNDEYHGQLGGRNPMAQAHAVNDTPLNGRQPPASHSSPRETCYQDGSGGFVFSRDLKDFSHGSRDGARPG
jgi:hypothetical protein